MKNKLLNVYILLLLSVLMMPSPAASITQENLLKDRCKTDKHAESCLLLGNIFYDGNNLLNAKIWYYEGCQLGDKLSCSALQEVYDIEKKIIKERIEGKKEPEEVIEDPGFVQPHISIKDLNEATAKKMTELKNQCVKEKYPAACYQLGILQSRYSEDLARPAFKFGCRLGHKPSCQKIGTDPNF